MVFFAAALPQLVPGLLLVGQQHHLRQKLVEGAPQTVAVAHKRLSRVERRGRTTKKRARDGDVDRLEDIDLPLRGPPISRSRACTHGRRRRGVTFETCAIESAHA
eukprot:1925637-Prymnesium_polylepis.1